MVNLLLGVCDFCGCGKDNKNHNSCEPSLHRNCKAHRASYHDHIFLAQSELATNFEKSGDCGACLHFAVVGCRLCFSRVTVCAQIQTPIAGSPSLCTTITPDLIDLAAYCVDTLDLSFCLLVIPRPASCFRLFLLPHLQHHLALYHRTLRTVTRSSTSILDLAIELQDLEDVAQRSPFGGKFDEHKHCPPVL